MVAPPPALSVPVWMSNGEFSSLLTPFGTGFALYNEHLLTSWEDDGCEDDLGFTLFLRDSASGGVWTACGAPLPGCDPGMLAVDGEGGSLQRIHAGIESTVRVAVQAQTPVERRRLSLVNCGPTPRMLEVTALVEVVLNYAAAHAAHPGFSKLFVQTHWDDATGLLIATRRPRANDERHPAMALALLGATPSGFETDRVRFLGRGRRLAKALALTSPLSNTVGNVLDPVLALRATVRLAPGESAELTFLTIAAPDLESLRGNLAAARTPAVPAPPQLLDGATDPLKDLPAARELLAGRLSLAPAAPTAPAPAPVRTLAAAAGAAAAADAADEAGATVGVNGYGAFSNDGREYRLRLDARADGTLRLPPMPWSNVIANESFGLIASEKGALSTYAGNSRLHRLTPWRNDPVGDPHDEAFYVRDASTGDFWSLLPGPAPAAAHYEVRHGFGYTGWRHRSAGLDHEVLVYVPRRDPLRIVQIRLRNPGVTERRLALYAYNRWVLGGTPAETRGQVTAAVDATRAAVLARNPGAGPFDAWIGFAAFAGIDSSPVDYCIDRAKFLGLPGFAEAPAAVRAGGALPRDAGSDPCAALRVEITVPAGGEIRLSALLGAATSADELDRLLGEYRRTGTAEREFDAVCAYWTDTLTRTQIKTPVAAIDLMVNGWLGYQTLTCRLWARTAYYQSGGAYGFRDQLQDAAALALSVPELLREQLLRNAAHQFVEGDVMHWWHPPESQGIRTRFADDLIWLPYLTAHYLAVTGDEAVLDQRLPFLAGPLLDAGEDERYFTPTVAAADASLYEHGLRALLRGMTRGANGLPLFGGGDWNDGMNRVGREGRGESVWMGFFLYAAIGEFLPIVKTRGTAAEIEHLESYRADLSTALNAAGWDGAWYRRGYYDNGAPLGSSSSDECRIDALVQAWSVIAKVASPERASLALDALERHLIGTDAAVIRLLTPPFENTVQDPGYIKGYVAGVRENGGQYTHAALWVVRAMAEAGRRDRAAELLEMLSPVTHTHDAAAVARYQVEPYVIAADVYGVAPHVGRGGWTWYTGSAGWMLRVAVETLLGFGIDGGKYLTLTPLIPDAWPGFELSHRRPDGTRYDIQVDNPHRAAVRIAAATLDGLPLQPANGGLRIALAGDGKNHTLHVTLGPR